MLAVAAPTLRPTPRPLLIPAVSLIWGYVVLDLCMHISVFAQQSRLKLFNSLTQDELGFKMDLLDIGGGFPGSDDAELQFEEVNCFYFFPQFVCFFSFFGVVE